MDKPKKPRGRPRLYPAGSAADNLGAPKLNIRFDPELYQRCVARPEGAREYLEALVRRDLENSGDGQAEK